MSAFGRSGVLDEHLSQASSDLLRRILQSDRYLIVEKGVHFSPSKLTSFRTSSTDERRV